MSSQSSHRRRIDRRGFVLSATASVAGLGLGGCSTLPRSGPLATDIDDAEAAGLVIPLTGPVANQVNRALETGFPTPFLTAGEIDPLVIGVDDAFDVLVWEASETALFGGGAGGAGTLPGVRVEPDGTVFLPFAGRVRAAGASPAELRDRIRRALEPFTNAPQVDLRLQAQPSRTLTIQGAVGAPGPYVIERAHARLLPMLALAGGATLDPERVQVAVRRGDAFGAAMLEDIYADPNLDIALRPGDLVVVTPLRERFLVLGASSIQAQIPFPTRDLRLLPAIATAGGLNDLNANPRGVFVFRWEDPAIADALLEAPPPETLPQGPGRAVVYRLNLTEPDALFVAQTFRMRDGDAIFVTNAPFTELRKLLQVFSTVVVPVQTTTTLVQ